MRGWAAEYLSDPRTWVAAGVLVAVALMIAPPVARRAGWPVWATVATLMSLAVVGVITLGPSPGQPVVGPSESAAVDCIRTLVDPAAWWRGLVSTTERGERVGNVLMFVPVGFFATLATRRPALVAVLGALAPLGVELGQVLIGGGRDCAANDWLNNATGALSGVAAAALLLCFLPVRNGPVR